MQFITGFSKGLNNIVWGIPMLILLIGTGIYLSVRLGFLQFRRFGFIMRQTVGRLFRHTKSRDGALTPIQALTTALAGTVGTGNIAGVAGAIALGGPGAIFWMWIAALFGMCTKYAEIILAVFYRRKNTKGDFVGGPMYYIRNGLGEKWQWMAALFCVFGMIAALGTGCMTQINTIATSIGSVVTSFNPSTSRETLEFIYLVVGVCGAFLTILVLFGGLQRIGSVTEKLVPVMALVYIVGSLIVIIMHGNRVPGVLRMIVEGAFRPQAVSSGPAGNVRGV